MKKYLVALYHGIESGNLVAYYTNFVIIEAENSKEAVRMYNEKHECSYWYGACIGEIQGETLLLPLNEHRPKYFRLEDIPDIGQIPQI